MKIKSNANNIINYEAWLINEVINVIFVKNKLILINYFEIDDEEKSWELISQMITQLWLIYLESHFTLNSLLRK